jgi:hypothetical protein
MSPDAGSAGIALLWGFRIGARTPTAGALVEGRGRQEAPVGRGHGRARGPLEADQRAAPGLHSLREAVRSPRRRRPTGAAPPLPYRLQTSGIGWLVAAVVLVGLTLVIFARGLRGPAVTATVIDDTVVGWLAGLYGPG